MPERHAAQTPDTVFSRRLCVDDLKAREGLIEANAAECARLASLCGAVNLAFLRFSYRLQPLASHRYRLTGELSAEVTQACVVTLEPVEERVQEAVTIEFWPEQQLGAVSADEDAAIDAEPSDAPEPIIGGRIDLGALAAEILASVINPYPRKADAEFVWRETPEGAEAGKSSPFASLAKLQRES